jgi:hypothetical protein
MTNNSEEYTDAIESSFEIYKKLDAITKSFFKKDKSFIQLVLARFKNREDRLDEFKREIMACKEKVKVLKTRRELPQDVILEEYLSLLENTVQLFLALVTVLKEAKDEKKTVPFTEYRMMVNCYRVVKRKLDSRPEVELGYALEQGEKLGLFRK